MNLFDVERQEVREDLLAQNLAWHEDGKPGRVGGDETRRDDLAPRLHLLLHRAVESQEIAGLVAPSQKESGPQVSLGGLGVGLGPETIVKAAEVGKWREALGPIDLVVIDGDHSYEGVRADFERELKLPHRFLVLHDIANDHPSCSGVQRLWRQISGTKRSFVYSIPGVQHHLLGIGVVCGYDATVSDEPVSPTPRPADTDISCFVQSIERPEWELTRLSLEASDIGTNYQRVLHPKHLDLRGFMLHLFEVMEKESDSKYVIRFEDDVFVNKHILHNVRTWPALSDARFGLGWLFNPAGEYTERTVLDRIYKRPGKDAWYKGDDPVKRIWRSFGVLFLRSDLAYVRDYMDHWFERNRVDFFDLAFAPAIAATGRWTCVHSPSLVERNVLSTTNLNHAYDENDESGGTFMSDWKRGRDPEP